MGLGKALYQKWVKDKGHFYHIHLLQHRRQMQTLFSSLANRGGSVRLASNRRIDVPENVGGPSRVPGSGVRGRGSGERETTASSLADKEESSRKEENMTLD